ncbi:MAG TPA: metal-dependent transcriptional regulator [Thermoanaerobaculia bacterium]|nr:metal-dependent transcriptional regulator [Thermoanaerobaculia bacterium]
MKMPTSTVEDYLKQILLEEQRTGAETRVPTGRIAQQLAVTPGSATAMVQTLAAGGLVDYEAYGGVRLTDDGRRLALHVLRRHRLVELFLVEVMGYDWSEVHPEAERLEHAVSERLVERIDEMLGRPAFDPHGDPIPTAAGELVPAELELLSTLPEGSRARVARVGDQDAEFLRRLESLGLTPGARLRVVARDESTDTLEVAPGARKATASLGLRAAAKILVEPD